MPVCPSLPSEADDKELLFLSRKRRIVEVKAKVLPTYWKVWLVLTAWEARMPRPKWGPRIPSNVSI